MLQICDKIMKKFVTVTFSNLNLSMSHCFIEESYGLGFSGSLPPLCSHYLTLKIHYVEEKEQL